RLELVVGDVDGVDLFAHEVVHDRLGDLLRGTERQRLKDVRRLAADGDGARRKKSLALRPIGSSSTDCQLFSRMAFCAALITLALKAPARPLSEETTTRRTFCSSRASSSGCLSSSTRVATEVSTSRS